MSIEPQSPSDPALSAGVPASAPAKLKPAPIAPWWHTLILVALILGNSFLGSAKVESVGSTGHGSRLLLYGGTFITQLILIIIIWLGIRSRGVRMRDVIGGEWKTVEAFLLDIGIAAIFWFVSLMLLFGLRVAFGLIDIHNLAKSQQDAIKLLAPLAPHSYLEAAFWVALAVSAGLFEEIIFRGYLQRQFSAFAGDAFLGVVVSGIVFGLAHGYQGWRWMIVIAAFGMLFGILAYFRKSLRPGMMAHAFQDSIAGIALFFLVRNHK